MSTHKCLGLSESLVRDKISKWEEIGYSNLKVLVISTEWNTEYVDQLTTLLSSELASYSTTNFTVNIDHKKVPGSWELPIGILQASKWENYNVVVAVGVLIKGDTKHFEYIAKSVFEGLMSLQLQLKTPIINGVLTVLKEEQIVQRIELAKGWARSAIMMCE